MLDAALACSFGYFLCSEFSIQLSGTLMSICHNSRFRQWTLAIAALVISCAAIAPAQNPAKASSSVAPAIWHDPGDIKSKDLLNGPGGEKHHPQLPVKFLKEDKHGQNSKFDVEDANGAKWKAKLGIEAQPEVVATRLLWAIGYFTNDNYYVPNLEVKELPAHLHRGQGHVISPDHLDGARLAAPSRREKKDANWNWQHNPFVGTREFNGLRVMMAFLSNWDLKDENNAIFTAKDGQQEYLVTDVGTAFGASGKHWTEAASKNNLKEYHKSQVHLQGRAGLRGLQLPPPSAAAPPACPAQLHSSGAHALGGQSRPSGRRQVAGLPARSTHYRSNPGRFSRRRLSTRESSSLHQSCTKQDC